MLPVPVVSDECSSLVVTWMYVRAKTFVNEKQILPQQIKPFAKTTKAIDSIKQRRHIEMNAISGAGTNACQFNILSTAKLR